jgi:putative colanic acid biosynthesis acetyltransferase WcaF
VTRPVVIEEDAWVAAEAFVGPGVVVGKGAVLGARAVTAKSLEPWTIYVGNPARPVGSRRQEAAASNALSR